MQALINDTLEALGSSPDGPKSIVEHKRKCEAKQATLEAFRKASEDNLSGHQNCVQELEHTKDTVA